MKAQFSLQKTNAHWIKFGIFSGTLNEKASKAPIKMS